MDRQAARARRRLGMLLVGALSPLRAAILAFVQLLGGIVGTAILDALTPGTSRPEKENSESPPARVSSGYFGPGLQEHSTCARLLLRE